MMTIAAYNLKGKYFIHSNRLIKFVLSTALIIVTEPMEVLERILHFGLVRHHTSHQIVPIKTDLPSDNQPQGFYFVKLQ